MKKIILLFILLPVFGLAQDVYIPDADFKKDLVEDIDINTNGDSEIQVSEAIAVTHTIVVGTGTTDITGIEAFTQLQYLYIFADSLPNIDISQNVLLRSLSCSGLSLNSLDVSANTQLNYLSCYHNNLTSLDLSNNQALSQLYVNANSLTELDVSNNPNLKQLTCNGNQLTSLDVSNNPLLIELECGHNKLTSLDVRNANNIDVVCWPGYPAGTCDYGFDARNNPELFCISVDYPSWANANWEKDTSATFSNDCSTLGVEDNNKPLASISSYNNTITVQECCGAIFTTSIYNLSGQSVYQAKLKGNTSISLGKGMYLVRVRTERGTTTKKVYLQ
ncbi:MAG: T9SS type A sorting domain-containing protein [Flavobacteriales bacterium]|nr:T9SS type A sorting domain-containing protein [Flavobacteriales bacterium]